MQENTDQKKLLIWTLHVVLCNTVTLLFKIGFFTYIIPNLDLNISEHLFNKLYPENIQLRFVSEWIKMAPSETMFQHLRFNELIPLDGKCRKIKLTGLGAATKILFNSNFWKARESNEIQRNILLAQQKTLWSVCYLCLFFFLYKICGGARDEVSSYSMSVMF